MRAFVFPCVAALVAAINAQQVITTVDALGNTIVEQVTLNAAGVPVTQILQTLPAGIPVDPTTTTPSTTVPTATTTPLLQTTTPLVQTTTQATRTHTSLITTTPLAVATTVQQGPVGQPASPPAEAGDPTPYSYTTTDADGDPTVVQDVFTPSFPATTPLTPTSTGSILGYSAWLSMIGNATAALSQPIASQIASGGVVFRSFGTGASILSSLVVGAVLVAVP